MPRAENMVIIDKFASKERDMQQRRCDASQTWHGDRKHFVPTEAAHGIWEDGACGPQPKQAAS